MDATAANEVAQLRAEGARLRSALQNIATTLESASDESLRAAVRMAKGMAQTALQVPAPPRPVSSAESGRPAPAGKRPVTEPGLPVFNATPVPHRPVTDGDQKVVIPPTREPAKKITEPSVDAISDAELARR